MLFFVFFLPRMNGVSKVILGTVEAVGDPMPVVQTNGRIRGNHPNEDPSRRSPELASRVLLIAVLNAKLSFVVPRKGATHLRDLLV